MARSKRGRRGSGGQFVPIPYLMARSEAWRSLRGGAVKVYVELRSRFNGGNNGRLSLSYADAAVLLGMSKTTVKRAFDELQAKGFILRTRPGQWYGRRAAEWAVCDRSLKGYGPTNAWQNWRAPAPRKNPASVSKRLARALSEPAAYPDERPLDRSDTRRPHLRVVDGAA